MSPTEIMIPSRGEDAASAPSGPPGRGRTSPRYWKNTAVPYAANRKGHLLVQPGLSGTEGWVAD